MSESTEAVEGVEGVDLRRLGEWMDGRGLPRGEIRGVERLGGDINKLATSPVPTLLISGEFDSITPAHSAAGVAGSLENSIEHTIPGAGHSAIENPCALSIFLQFLNDPTTEPDASCLSELPGVQFKVDGTGPSSSAG